MRRFSLILLLLLVISLFNFRVVGLPTTTLTFKVLERDYNQYFILDFEGSDDIDYSYTITEDDPDNKLDYEEPIISTDYAHSDSHSLRFKVHSYDVETSNPSCTITYKFTIHEIFYKYKIEVCAYVTANVKVYVDGELVDEDSLNGGTSGDSKVSVWKEVDKNTTVHGVRELKFECSFSTTSSTTFDSYVYFYIDDGKKFKDVVVERSLTVEYWSERIDVDKCRVHYTLDSSQLTGKWWVAYIEGDYYLEEGNGGRYGGLYFDGTDDYVEVIDSSVLNSDTFTVIGSIRPTLPHYSSTTNLVVGKVHFASPPNGKGWYFRFIGQTSLNLQFGVYLKDSEPKLVYTITEEWHHFAGVYNGTNMILYVDGVKVKERAGGTNYQKPIGINLLIGGKIGYYHGYEAFIQVYNRTLSSDEIYNNYINEEPTNSTGLVLYLSRWSIDPYSGYWYDISGYSNHGTIYGASVSSEKALGLTICPGSSEWKFYRDYTESSYPHSHYFVIFRFDNGTLCNSTVQINFGTSEEEVSNWIWYKERSQITQEFYTIKNGSDWYRHFRVHPSVTAYVPTPTDTYSYITFNIHDYTGSFKNSSLLVYDTQSRLIQEELITSTYQAVCYLKAYGSYLIVIKKNSEERVIGWIVVSSTEKDLYIGVLPPTYTSLFKDVKYSVEDDESNTQMTITINASSSFNYKVEIYRNGTSEFSKEGSGVTAVSITYDYTETGFREVHITITDPSTSQSMTRIHYTGRAIEQMPTPPERIPLITQLLNNTVMNQLQQYSTIGLENIIAYLLAISVFLLLATKYSLGAGMIGSGIVIIFVKAYLGSVTAFPDLMISTIIIFGGIYELTKKR